MLRPKKHLSLQVSSPEEVSAVPIVGDAAIATRTIGHGRLIPLVILDTTDRPDLEEVIKAQRYVTSGKVTTQWGALPKRTDHFALILKFEMPIERVAIIEFNISTKGVLVEQAFQAGAIYLQCGKPGDRLTHDLDRPKMLVEIVTPGAQEIWNKLHIKAIEKKMRQKGLGRREARERAKEFLDSIRKLSEQRI